MAIRKTFSATISLSAFAVALGSMATPAFAQDEDTDEATETAETTDGNVIIVSGYRASLENAVAEKRRSDLVVESVSAEDIGKLPDASIAESIARLPGLTSQRLSGRSNSISIRGFSPDFSTTLLNGREQTTTGDNRAVEYDQYPAEVINQVNVYKTPMASLVGQGLSGTVDLRTIRPLDAGKTIFSIGARGSYADLGKLNVESNDMGYRVNGLIVTQFADNKIGLSLGASYVDEPYQIQEFNAWGYPTTGDGDFVIGGSKSYVTSTQLTRLGLNGTLQFEISPTVTSTLDAFYSDFKDDQIKRGIELPLYWSGAVLQPDTTVENGFVTAGQFNGVKGVGRSDVFQRKAKLYSFGWNTEYEGDDGWNAMLDLSYSKTDRNELSLESNWGTGRGSIGATDNIGFQSGPQGTVFSPMLDYGNFNTMLLTSPQGWGGNQIAPNGDSILGGQDGYYNNRIIKDTIWQARMEVEKEFNGNFFRSLQAGVNFTDRSKSLVPDEYFLGLVANTDGLTSVQVPEQFRLGTTDLTYLGLGPVISYNPLDLLDAGIYKLVPNAYGDVVVKSYSVNEKLLTPYVQLNIASQLGGAELTGNIGVQAAITDQNSSGATAVYLGQLDVPEGCAAAGEPCAPNIGAQFQKFSTSYTNWLPSLNLSLRFDSGFVVRAAAAREIIRPRMDDMRNSLSFGYQFVTLPNGTTVAAVTGSSGNPNLRPWLANAFDLTFEKYFGNKGYLAAQFFYKDLKSYIYNQDVVIPTSDLALASPGEDIVIAPTAVLNIPINGEGGSLYGVEVAGTLPFETFTAALDGFGITGGVSYTKTKISPTPGAPSEDLPGYSKWVANGTAFFEKWGFNARASIRYRSTFVGEVSGFAANRVRRRAAPETIIDAQIGYDFQDGSPLEGLSLFLQGQNLTDEPFVTTNPGDPRQVIDYQTYGRRFMAGFNYKF
ncbi:TonB-dependent receptor [Qipengyuania sp. YG27]|uniref:TonB-dependent receptor n=1 Tax=Qipengyuania mesophila TaxID=2867246 RepID=A0ABS7JXC8_9SPHN|nr:TonB-dependent receptor [Qipengyuania mesophila]MBX7502312.1 TonB-dependent receptor [Qipengyuania mesophila]